MRKDHTKWYMLFILLMITTGASMGGNAYAPLSSFLMKSFGLSNTHLGLLGSAFYGGAFFCAILSGWAIDQIGEKKMILLGPVIMSSALIGLSYCQSFLSLLLFTLLNGIGFSTISNLTNIGIYGWFPPKQRAFAIGLKQSGTPLGIAIGALLLPGIALVHNWQRCYGLVGIGFFVIAVICFFLYRQPPARSILQDQNQPVLESPGSNFKYFTNPQILLCGLMGIAFCMSQSAITTFIFPYFHETLSLTPTACGHYLALAQLSGAVSRPLFGLITDRLFGGNSKNALFTLSLLATLAVIVLSAVPPGLNNGLLSIIVAVAGFTTMGWFGPFYAHIIEISGGKQAGLITGTAVTINLLGILTGSPLFGLIVDFTKSYGTAYRLFSLFLAIIGFVFMFAKVDYTKHTAEETARESLSGSDNNAL